MAEHMETTQYLINPDDPSEGTDIVAMLDLTEPGTGVRYEVHFTGEYTDRGEPTYTLHAA